MTSSLSGDQLVLLFIKVENLTNQVPVYNELYADQTYQLSDFCRWFLFFGFKAIKASIRTRTMKILSNGFFTTKNK